MPEGDTIFRAAVRLNQWIKGRTVTGVKSKALGSKVDRLVGSTVEAIEPRGKHLLMRFSNGFTLHSHMRMTGSWHTYSAKQTWRKPNWQAKIAIECDDHIAVCFNAPVVELLKTKAEHLQQGLSTLGPDILNSEFDVTTVSFPINTTSTNTTATNATTGDTTTSHLTIGELLLDQRVVAGIGNIYRCEALFVERINPWQPTVNLDRARFEALILTAQRLMKENIEPYRFIRTINGNKPWVYQRTGRPCRKCFSLIRSRLLGSLPRRVYWCPQCQAGGPEVRA